MNAGFEPNIGFVDSNVWLYLLLTGQDTAKAEIARQLLRQTDIKFVISSQVINEVINGLIRHAVLNEKNIRELIHRLYVRYEPIAMNEAIHIRASELREAYSFSYWDSLIVSSALYANATILYSEDMQNGLLVADQLRIVNPFLESFTHNQLGE